MRSCNNDESGEVVKWGWGVSRNDVMMETSLFLTITQTSFVFIKLTSDSVKDWTLLNRCLGRRLALVVNLTLKSFRSAVSALSIKTSSFKSFMMLNLTFLDGITIREEICSAVT